MAHKLYSSFFSSSLFIVMIRQWEERNTLCFTSTVWSKIKCAVWSSLWNSMLDEELVFVSRNQLEYGLDYQLIGILFLARVLISWLLSGQLFFLPMGTGRPFLGSLAAGAWSRPFSLCQWLGMIGAKPLFCRTSSWHDPKSVAFLTFIGPCIAIYCYRKHNKMWQLLKFILFLG
jgi:hypothetical protein